jgi:hypothetical protein
MLYYLVRLVVSQSVLDARTTGKVSGKITGSGQSVFNELIPNQSFVGKVSGKITGSGQSVFNELIPNQSVRCAVRLLNAQLSVFNELITNQSFVCW